MQPPRAPRLQRRWPLAIFAAMAVTVQFIGTPATAAPPAPSAPPAPTSGSTEWELPTSLRDNGLRGDVVLNGYWARSVRAATGETDGVETRVAVPCGMPEIKGGGKQALRREFVVPAAWRDRRVTLEVSASTTGEVVIDGTKVGTTRGSARFTEFDLPAPPGGDVAAPRVVSVVTPGRILDDVWLRSYPVASAGGSIDDSHINPSFRQRSVAVRLTGRAPAGPPVTLNIRISDQPDDGPPVKSFSVTVDVRGDGTWSAEPTDAWRDAKLWSRDYPNLYWYTAELVDASGKVVDRLLPRRFGFREVWTDGGQWFVNGVQTNYVSDSWGAQIDRAGNANRTHAGTLMKSLKVAGHSFSQWGPRSELGLDVAAENGVMCLFPIGGTVRINVWDPRNGLTDMGGDARVEDILRIVRRLREQPAILGWVSSTAYSQASMHPEFNGRPFETWKYFPLTRDSGKSYEAQRAFRRVRDIVSAVDPTRTVNCHNGPWTSVDMTTKYLTNDLDLQEREEFMDDWSRSDPSYRQVISAAEVGMPFPGEYFLRKIDFQLTQTQGNVWRIFAESAARYYGEGVYLANTDEQVAAWTRTDSYVARSDAIFQRLVSENVGRTTRAWRTYGANFVGHHILNEDGYARAPKSTATPATKPTAAKAAPLDPRQVGYAAGPRPTWPTPETAELLPTGRAHLAASTPLLAYLGGADGRFTAKDHLFYAGDPVRKAAIVVNDRDDAAALRGGWSLVDSAGAVVLQGAIEGNVAAGRRALNDFPIAFDAPQVERRTDFTLRLDLTSPTPGTLGDAMAITVFPRPSTPAARPAGFTGTVWTLNISDDLTHETPHFVINRDNAAFLTAAGLGDARLVKGLRTFAYSGVSLDQAREWHTTRQLITDGQPAPGDLLVIPRRTISASGDDRLNLRLLEQMGLDRLVEQGLRVVVFEQDVPNLMGLQTENVRPRTAFIAASGHPVLDGLTDTDLSYWGGASDLQGPTTPISPSDDRFPERMWRVSNTNAVATRTLVRPQVGASRALAVSGFDLQESPLLEVTRGRGRILFCQFDVTNRYGKDPAATRLVDNLLRYAMTAPQPDPARANIATASGEGVAVRHNPYRAAKPEGPAGWGITHGELFFRESVYNDTYGTKPNLDVPVFASEPADAGGRPSVVRVAADGTFTTTLTPEVMKTGWGKRKVMWLRSTLVVNGGGSLPDGPGVRHHGRTTDLYPVQWVEGFVHPYTSNIW